MCYLGCWTTSSRAILFDQKGNQVALAQQEFTQIFPEKGWVEHNPIEIWETQINAVKNVLKKAHITAEQVDSIGITNQRETTIIWDRATGVPVLMLLYGRTAGRPKFVRKLAHDKSDIFTQKTGLVVDAYFLLPRLNGFWIKTYYERSCL